MALSDQIKVPAQVKGAVGGGGSGGGSSAFGDITGWPGASTDFIRGDGSDGPLSATDMPTQPSLVAQISSGQSFGDAVILFDTPVSNIGPGWSYSAGTWTCLIAGWYSVRVGTYSYSSNSAEIRIRRNSTTVFSGHATAGNAYPWAYGIAYWDVGDTMQARVYSFVGLTLDVSLAGYRDLYVLRVA